MFNLCSRVSVKTKQTFRNLRNNVLMKVSPVVQFFNSFLQKISSKQIFVGLVLFSVSTILYNSILRVASINWNWLNLFDTVNWFDWSGKIEYLSLSLLIGAFCGKSVIRKCQKKSMAGR